jgi:hypothetical protein
MEATSANGVAQIMTDDGDYVTVPGIHAFPASFNATAQAHAQDTLRAR